MASFAFHPRIYQTFGFKIKNQLMIKYDTIENVLLTLGIIHAYVCMYILTSNFHFEYVRVCI
jgi:hypothetical protein